MLVLSRRAEEEIIIGDGDDKIIITVLKVGVDKVSIGIEANPEIGIYRKELLEGHQGAVANAAASQRHRPSRTARSRKKVLGIMDDLHDSLHSKTGSESEGSLSADDKAEECEKASSCC